MSNKAIVDKKTEIADLMASNRRDIEYIEFSIDTASKELATLETDILALQSKNEEVAAQSFLDGKPKLLSDHEAKITKAEARRHALQMALGGLKLRLGVLGQVRGQLNRQESLFGRFEGSVRETLAAIDEFREVRAKLDAVPKGTPEVRRMVLREHELSRDNWGRVPLLVKQLGVMAVELDLYQPVRDILTDAGAELNLNKITVLEERSWWIQTGSKARSA